MTEKRQSGWMSRRRADGTYERFNKHDVAKAAKPSVDEGKLAKKKAAKKKGRKA